MVLVEADDIEINCTYLTDILVKCAVVQPELIVSVRPIETMIISYML